MYRDKYKDKSDYYDKYRPRYPEKCVNEIIDIAGIKNGALIADIGAGTGIFTRMFFKNDYEIYAVESSHDMIEKLHKLEYDKLHSIEAMAESTGIENNSINLVIVAQAFHWFEKDKFKKECERILKTGSYVALVWNEIDYLTDVGKEIKEVIKEYTGGINTYTIDLNTDNSLVDGFFYNNIYEKRAYDNTMYLDKEQFIGNYLSKSYTPSKEDIKSYEEYINKFNIIFNAYCSEGNLKIKQNTFLYIGKI